MKILDQKEISSTFDDFLNEHGLWNTFVNFIEERGYQIEEFGMSE